MKKNQESLLIKSLKNKDFEKARTLIREKRGINDSDKEGCSAVHLALCVCQKNPEIVELLIKNGANVKAKNENTLLSAVVLQYPCEIVKMILDKGAEINQVNNFNENALYYAVRDVNFEVVQLLLERGIEPEPKKANYCILNIPNYHEGCEKNCYKMYKLLLEKGAGKKCIAKKQYRKALFHRTARGDSNFVELLCQHGVSVNDYVNDMHTLLTLAALVRKRKLMKFLIKNKADVNLKGGGGLTPIMYSAIIGDLSAVKLFLDNGADIKIKHENKTVIELANKVKLSEKSPKKKEQMKKIIEILSNNTNKKSTEVEIK